MYLFTRWGFGCNKTKIENKIFVIPGKLTNLYKLNEFFYIWGTSCKIGQNKIHTSDIYQFKYIIANSFLTLKIKIYITQKRHDLLAKTFQGQQINAGYVIIT